MKAWACLGLCLANFQLGAVEITPWLQISAKGEAGYTSVRQQPKSLRPWWQEGTGQLAAARSDWMLGPQLASIHITPDSDFSATINGQWQQIPDKALGLTEYWINYAPLPISGYRLRARAGWFYPAMSLENSDVAWSSPYSSSFSAINSWIGEELRSQGVELSLSRPGNAFNSAHNFTAVAGGFRGNDPIGTLISWRGFAIHSNQTNLNQDIDFAYYPSLEVPPLNWQPNWVKPFVEIDDRLGYYLGLHWQWQQQTELRFYFYDNNADPSAFAMEQYAWHTQFSHLAWHQQLNDRWQLVAQWMNGNTEMGPGVVNVDFNLWFLLANYQLDDWQFSARLDHWQQMDRDLTPLDDNNGNGEGLTASVQYQLTPEISVQLEWLLIDTSQQSRGQWQHWPIDRKFGQSSLLLVWRLPE